MKTITNNLLLRYFGMTTDTALKLSIIISGIFFIVGFLITLILFIMNPEAANTAHWGYAE